MAMDRFLASVEQRAFRMAEIATGESQTALDMVQDAMLAFVRYYSHKSEVEWKPLFFRILQNRIKDWYRRRSIRSRWESLISFRRGGNNEETDCTIEELPDPACIDPAETVSNQDSMAALEAALRRLPVRQQQAFLLRAWEEMNVSETAAVMGCSEGSVKTHYFRAVRSLRTLLEEHKP